MKSEVAATLPNMDAARRVVMELESAGIEARRISLIGAGVEDARQRERQGAMTRRDRSLLARVLWKGVLYSLIAVPPGALFGVILDILGLSPVGLLLNVIFWALFWHIMGAMWGIYAAVGAGEAWEMSFEGGGTRPVVVRVRSDDARDLARAERVLRRAGPAL